MNNASRRRLATILLIVASWVGIVTTLDPTNAGFGSVKLAVLKYMPFWLAAIASLLYFFSSKPHFNKASVSLTVFVSVMILGSLWGIVIDGASLQESYLGRAMGGFVVISFLLISKHESEVHYFFRFFVPALFISVIIMFIVLVLFRIGVIYQELPQMYQVKTILFASAGVLSLLRFKNKKVRILMFLVAALGLLLIQKTTALLLLVMLCGYGLYVFIITGKEKLQASLNKVGIWGLIISGVLIITISVVVVGFSLIDHRVGEGARDNEVRAITMEVRLSEFVASPIYGNLFSGSPLVDVSTLHIPSHSDMLDLLAMGGAISILLFFYPVLFQVLKSIRIRECLNSRNWLSFTTLVSMVVMVVNPIFAMPGLAFVFWMSLGLLVSSFSIHVKQLIIK